MQEEMTTPDGPLDFGDSPSGSDTGYTPLDFGPGDGTVTSSRPAVIDPLAALPLEQVRSMPDDELRALLRNFATTAENHRTQRARALELEDRNAHLAEQVEWHHQAAESAGLERDRAYADRDSLDAKLRDAKAELTRAKLAVADMQEVCSALSMAVKILQEHAPSAPGVELVEQAAARFDPAFVFPVRSGPLSAPAPGASASTSEQDTTVVAFRRPASSDSASQD